MSKQAHKLFPQMIYVLALLFAAVVSAQAQGTYELRCRGGAEAFTIDRLDENKLSLNFSASARPAGANERGLEPGTCSWVDRVVNEAEPKQIQFAASEAEATSIPQRLKNPAKYWSFFVFSTNEGYFEAKSHKAWQPAASADKIVNSQKETGSVKEVVKPTYREEDFRRPAVLEVSVIPTDQSVTISFKSYPNTVPLVEIAKVQPVRGADKRWGFPSGSGVITRPAGGDKANGKYTVDMNQELDPGVTYYYIISAKSDNSSSAERGQSTGKFRAKAALQATSYEVRYRGFFSRETTTGPGNDEIYAIVSISFVYPTGGPGTFTGMHPAGIVRDVGSNEAHGDPGRMVYRGEPLNLLLTVTLMEHDQGDPQQYTKEVRLAVYNALNTLNVPSLTTAVYLSLWFIKDAVTTVENAVNEVLGTGDDVISTTSRLITADEMKSMANRDGAKPSERGISYDFFTEHRGQGGIYKVYFDIIPK